MKSSDIALTLFILLIFVLLTVINMMSVGIKKVQDDWPLYRCNPIVMPFANIFGHDTMSNFVYCIQSMQTDYMDVLLQPLNYNFSVITSVGDVLNDSVNSARKFFSNLRNMISDTIASIFGVFLSILIEFQRVTINIKDIFGKVVGILATIIHTLNGSIMTMESTWAGPPGQMVRSLCFDPDTKLNTETGHVAMSDVKLGSKMKNNTIVQAVLRISNIDEDGNQIEAVYKIDNGENNEPIYVSGSHLVYDPTLEEYVQVKNLRGKKPSVITDRVCKEFACLITSNHTIPIGEWLFHDWEDNNGSPSKTVSNKC